MSRIKEHNEQPDIFLGSMIAHQYYFIGGNLVRRTVWDRKFLSENEFEHFIQRKKKLLEKCERVIDRKKLADDIAIYIKIKQQFTEYKKMVKDGKLKIEESYAAE